MQVTIGSIGVIPAKRTQVKVLNHTTKQTIMGDVGVILGMRGDTSTKQHSLVLGESVLGTSCRPEGGDSSGLGDELMNCILAAVVQDRRDAKMVRTTWADSRKAL